jgi:flagellar P-ring protein precursor FlgI
MGKKTSLPSAFLILALLVLVAEVGIAATARLKDLVHVRGVRSNFLNGIGIVVGLKATGDSKKSLATNKAVANMLTRMGMRITAEDVVSGNMAAVLVTGELPPFARSGETIDVKVSVVGDAKSLAGGTLIMTPLAAMNGDVYAVAQGPVVVGQASGNGPQVLTVARVPQGGVIEREFIPSIAGDGKLVLSLIQPDFTTSSRIAEAINRKLKGFFAEARDIGSITLTLPSSYRDHVVEFMAEIEALTVDADTKAVVILNERTGTVVMGSQIVLSPVAIAHGDLSIRIGGGNAKNTGQKTLVGIKGSTVGDLIETLNGLGVKPGDLVGILQSLHAAGALKAELRFI